jgi:hypothetical protein
MNCGICNQEMEHINDIGLRCMNCDLDQEPTKEVYVVVRMYNGLVDDVEVFREEPQGTEEICEDTDNGEHVYCLTIEDKYIGEADND